MESTMSNILILNKKFFLVATVLSLIIIFFFTRDFSPDTKIASIAETNAPSKKPEHQNPHIENLTEVSESVKNTTNLKNETTKINNSVPIASSNTEASKDDATPKTFEELAEAYNVPIKTRESRPKLEVFDEHAKERLNKIITNGAGCNHEANIQECEKIFSSLKTQADAGEAKAILQYGKSRLQESYGPLLGSSDFNERLSQYEEGKSYLLQIGSQLSGSDAASIGITSSIFNQEESLAWFLIAKRLGYDARPSSYCKLNRLQCTPEQFFKAKDIADAYVDLYQIDK